MRVRRGVVTAVAAAIVAAGLAGCVPDSAAPARSPSPTATPVFASDAEALKAAEDAYAAYQAAIDKSLSTLDDDAIDAVATGDALSQAKRSVASFKEKGRHQVGTSKVRSVAPVDLSSLLNAGLANESAQIYACLDVSGVSILDESGSNVSSVGRETVFPTLVTLEWSPRRMSLLVAEESVWDGQNFCV